MKLVTWNINSIKTRMPLILEFATTHKPDVICLQEVKFTEDNIDLEQIKALGYKHCYINGEKSYNGVAIFSKFKVENVFSEDFGVSKIPEKQNKKQARHIAATINGVEIHNFYVPAGGDEPDEEINPKFGHKLQFVEDMTAYFSKRDNNDNIVVVGDLNIAPLENDVWSHKQLLKIVSHTPAETSRFNKLMEAANFIDAPRLFYPETEKLYSWWSYRNKDWRKSNRGRRLDHILCTPPLKDKIKSAEFLSEARDWLKPSDHVPVIVELAV